MVEGVTNGYRKTLEISGVGYRAARVGPRLTLQVGFSHPVEIAPPPGIAFEVETPTRFHVTGIDKALVGETAAQVRRIRPPEPYLGKGIRYAGERIRRKAGKAGKVGANASLLAGLPETHSGRDETEIEHRDDHQEEQ